ncbi:Fpg/Nei family DNA glycosylase [Paenibacillus gansuensis]|uniref:Formamidopyrimidine-DNA glycosylase n=1 Tax=Paenibacillus gansuensis TaxID=306542 RepID=A0ABW5PAD3_9BACL
MPELPEMETYKQLLTEKTAGKKIGAVTVEREKSVNMPASLFSSELEGRTVTSYGRRGKHLLFFLDDGRLLALHLMLGGWMFYGIPEEKPDRSTQVVLQFGDERLFFFGLRLGYLHLLTAEEAYERFSQLGPEPLDEIMTEQAFHDLISSKSGALKPKLVDQSVLAGIGNCYSDEICYHAGIRPDRSIQGMPDAAFSLLYRSMHEVFEEAIRYGGYMENPLYTGDKLTGGFNDRCRVYDREGQPCLRCGHPIVKRMFNSRKLFYCANCQR